MDAAEQHLDADRLLTCLCLAQPPESKQHAEPLAYFCEDIRRGLGCEFVSAELGRVGRSRRAPVCWRNASTISPAFRMRGGGMNAVMAHREVVVTNPTAQEAAGATIPVAT